ncbi:hypothetical protein Mycsm_03622 [Mycobacterium sp. JS623]|nr:hypothetical protein Mycsm_03622 [Mycobacterium sp. JS623]
MRLQVSLSCTAATTGRCGRANSVADGRMPARRWSSALAAAAICETSGGPGARRRCCRSTPTSPAGREPVALTGSGNWRLRDAHPLIDVHEVGHSSRDGAHHAGQMLRGRLKLAVGVVHGTSRSLTAITSRPARLRGRSVPGRRPMGRRRKRTFLLWDVVEFVGVGPGAASLSAVQAADRVHLVVVQAEVEDLEI